MDLRKKTINALAWSSSLQTLSQLLNFSLSIFLARLLTPHDFGLVAMVLVFTAFSQLLSDFGLSSALIQRNNLTSKHYSSAFWFSAGIGSLLSLLLFFSAPKLAYFYDSDEVEGIAKCLSIIFLANSLSSVPKAILSKKLEHKKISTIDLGSGLAGGLAGILLALNGFSYWSIVIQWLVINWSKTIALYVISGFKVKFSISLSSLKDLMSFGLFVFCTQTLRQITVQADKVLIGRYIDSVTLGLYSRAHQLMSVPTKSISQVVSNVMFPALSTIQNDKPRIANIYLKTIGSIALISYPILAGIAMVAPYFINVVLGEQWIEMTIYIRYFCLVGFFTSVATITGVIYLSLDKTALQLKVNLINQPLQLTGIFIGIQYGVLGMMLGYIITYIIAVLITWYIAASLIGISVLDIIKKLSTILPAIIFMMVAIYTTDTFLLKGFGDVIKLLGLTIVGGTSYILILFIYKPKVFTDIISIIQEKMVKSKNEIRG